MKTVKGNLALYPFITIVAKNDFCNSIDITITILDYHCNTIVILFACLKEEIKIMVGLFCMYRYQFCFEPTEKYQNVVKVHLSY